MRAQQATKTRSRERMRRARHARRQALPFANTNHRVSSDARVQARQEDFCASPPPILIGDPSASEPAQATREIYRRALQALCDEEVPFLVGGAYALVHYAGVLRTTHDLDVFVRRRDIERALDVLSTVGFETRLAFPHWLGKAIWGSELIDVIFSSGNGLAEVDDVWFQHATQAQVFGLDVLLCPAEEIVWAKAFIMERERFDGADVAHILRSRADRLDWRRLLERFGAYYRVLLSQIVLYGFIYPGERDRIPSWVLPELLTRLQEEHESRPEATRVCRGTLLSRAQYLPDIHCAGYEDARLAPEGSMSPEEIAHWTAAIGRNG